MNSPRKMGPKKKKGDGSEDTGKPKNSKLNKMNEMDRVRKIHISNPGVIIMNLSGEVP